MKQTHPFLSIHQLYLDKEPPDNNRTILIRLKTGDEKLKEQNGFLNLVLESLSHPFYVINADDYTIQLANSMAKAEGTTGKSTCYALNHKRQSPAIQQSIPALWK